MKVLHIFFALLIFLYTAGCLYGCHDRAARGQKNAIDSERDYAVAMWLRSGWGVVVEPDGSGDYSYGDGFPKISFPPNTFVYAEVKARLFQHSVVSVAADGSPGSRVVGIVCLVPMSEKAPDKPGVNYLTDGHTAESIFNVAHARVTSKLVEETLKKYPISRYDKPW